MARLQHPRVTLKQVYRRQPIIVLDLPRSTGEQELFANLLQLLESILVHPLVLLVLILELVFIITPLLHHLFIIDFVSHLTNAEM